MVAGTRGDLVIALDYYDGEVEGFARCGGEFSYFKRISIGDDDVNEYESVSLDRSLFDDIAGWFRGDLVPGKVFVYSGSDSGLNQRLEALVPPLRLQLQRIGRRLRGCNYLDAATSQ